MDVNRVSEIDSRSAALIAAHPNPSLKSYADHRRKAGKPHEVIITAVARKLVTIANALCKNRRRWALPTD